jgi:hypothetical protein
MARGPLLGHDAEGLPCLVLGSACAATAATVSNPRISSTFDSRFTPAQRRHIDRIVARRTAGAYRYHVTRTHDADEFVATVDGWPSLSFLAPTPARAVTGLVRTVSQCILDMRRAGESVPKHGRGIPGVYPVVTSARQATAMRRRVRELAGASAGTGDGDELAMLVGALESWEGRRR